MQSPLHVVNADACIGTDSLPANRVASSRTRGALGRVLPAEQVALMVECFQPKPWRSRSCALAEPVAPSEVWKGTADERPLLWIFGAPSDGYRDS
jgi:hypothetical protein